jgi:hypothetical protein
MLMFVAFGVVIRLTKDDILQIKLVDNPDWYRCAVDRFAVESAKKDQSTNYVFYCKVNEGKEKGVPTRVSFSEKFLGPFAGFAKACGAEVGEEGGAFNPESFEGKELYIFIEPKENPNDKKIYNTPNGFMSIENYAAFAAQEDEKKAAANV